MSWKRYFRIFSHAANVAEGGRFLLGLNGSDTVYDDRTIENMHHSLQRTMHIKEKHKKTIILNCFHVSVDLKTSPHHYLVCVTHLIVELPPCAGDRDVSGEVLHGRHLP